MKRIVVPTDFSGCALSALKVAALISKKVNAVISIVHTYELPIYGFTDGLVMYDGAEVGKIKEELSLELDKLSKLDFLKSVDVETYLLTDYDVAQITDHENLKNTDLIVMGTHGVSGWKEDFVGSNTEQVVRKVDCPVLAIREEAGDHFNPNKIVFASNFYREVYERFPTIKAFAELFEAEIILLRINTVTDFESTTYSEILMNDFKDRFELKDAPINIFDAHSVEEGVLTFANRIGADLIAMETHGRRGLNHFFNGSIAEDLANHSTIPLLTFKIKKPERPKGVIFPE